MDNLWGKIAKERGVELNEEFIWVFMGSNYKYKITTCGLHIFIAEQWCSSCAIDEFIAGAGTIEKLPFRPQLGDKYYSTFMDDVVSDKWVGSTVDYTRLIAGIIFRTEKEARDYIPTWLDRISKL